MAATSAGILMYAATTIVLRFSSSIQVALLAQPRFRRVVTPEGRTGRQRESGGRSAARVRRRARHRSRGHFAVAWGQVRQRASKIVHGYTLEGDLNATSVRSNEFSMEWPPRSGRRTSFPESIGQRGSHYRLPKRRSSQASDRFLIVSKSSGRTQTIPGEGPGLPTSRSAIGSTGRLPSNGTALVCEAGAHARCRSGYGTAARGRG